MKKSLIAAVLCVAAGSAFADHSLVESVETVVLKDGSTLYIFADGKMAMTDKVGRIYRMKPGQSMQTVDGKAVIMVGDEVQRLQAHLYAPHRGG